MELTDQERAMADGAEGAAVQWAIQSQIEVGKAFGANRLIPVSCAHMMGDMEVLTRHGYDFIARLAGSGATVCTPTTTNARCVDFDAASLLRQDPQMVADEARLKQLLGRMGVVLTDTCVNYQTVYQPTLGEHIAWGDTGTVIYANSVFGARSNFESGPAALAAGLTGRTPEYGFHLPEARRGTVRVELDFTPEDLSDWGAIGAVVGREVNDYWAAPVFTSAPPGVSSDAIKHLGAALASYGSLAMFHMVGVTPEAPDEETAFGGNAPQRTVVVNADAIRAVYESYPAPSEPVDLVVLTGPQLSIFELRAAAQLIEGRRVHPDTTFLITTNAQNRHLASQLGYLDVLSKAGATVLAGTCFYLMNVPAMRREFGWDNVITNSAKLANIVGGYGLRATFRRTAECVDAAVTGRVADASDTGRPGDD
ncbi:MAG: aconitase X [Micromonosporaceae bacterium]